MSKKKKREDKKSFQEILKNPWAVSTLVLAVLLIAVILLCTINKGSVNADVVGQKVLDFAKSQGANAELVSVNDKGSVYEVVLSIQGRQIPVYATKDGKNLATNLIPLDGSANSNSPSPSPSPSPSQNIPKSDKPKVELFVMSYCPFGTQMEKGILPVVKTLGDKIDFQLKFVNYAMHPSKGEVEENLRQYCIEKEQKDKLVSYLTCFLEAGDSEGCLKKTNIDTSKLNSCIKVEDEKFNVTKNLNDRSSWLSGQFPRFLVHDADNQKYGVRGSPTLVINGVQVQSGRDSVSLLNTICSAFNSKPEECNTEFEPGQPSPGFGWKASTATNAASAGCGV